MRKTIGVAVSCLALLLASVTLGPRVSAEMTRRKKTEKQAFQALPTSQVNGVDGYIRGSVSIMDDPQNERIVEWAQVANSGYAPDQWAQIGQMQGCVGYCPDAACIYTPTTIHQYAE